jgi:hypothetical protein
MNIYCPSCFKKNQVLGKKLESCEFCGKKFSSQFGGENGKQTQVSRVQALSAKAEIRQKKIEKDYEDEIIDDDGFVDDNFQPGQFDKFLDATVRNIKSFGVSTDVEKNNSVNLGEILNKKDGNE